MLISCFHVANHSIILVTWFYTVKPTLNHCKGVTWFPGNPEAGNNSYISIIPEIKEIYQFALFPE